MGAWPFPDPPEAEVIALAPILRGVSPLLLVTRDEDDGSWQFLDGEHVFEEDAALISLGEMARFDPTIFELADLPLGGFAWRPGPEASWRRGQGDPPVHPPGRDEG